MLDLIKHSQDKDQFLKVAIMWMPETQSFEDKLNEVGELNSILYAQNQELEAKLAEESQEKDGKVPESSYLNNR
jgi:hypothetical protein